MALLTAALDAGVPPDSGLESLPGYGDKLYALAIACEFGHLSSARALLMAGADVDQQGRNGSALAETARVGQLECMRLLLECNADVHARDWEGRTALFSKGRLTTSCVERDQTACTRLLLKAGADVNAANYGGYTALMHAALYGKRSLSPLLEAGADVHAANANGFTPMLSACRSGLTQTSCCSMGSGPTRTRSAPTEPRPSCLPAGGAMGTLCGGSSTRMSTSTRCSRIAGTGTQVRLRS